MRAASLMEDRAEDKLASSLSNLPYLFAVLPAYPTAISSDSVWFSSSFA